MLIAPTVLAPVDVPPRIIPVLAPVTVPSDNVAVVGLKVGAAARTVVPVKETAAVEPVAFGPAAVVN